MATEYQRARKRRDAERQAKRKQMTPLTPPRPKYPPDVAEARNRERNRRAMEARRRAYLILALRHEDEFKKLVTSETKGVHKERGPMPGDDL